jgi:hypothetical protein
MQNGKVKKEIVSPGRFDPQIKNILRGITTDNLSRHKPAQNTPIMNKGKRKSEEPKVSAKRKQKTITKTTKSTNNVMSIDMLPNSITNISIQSPHNPSHIHVPDTLYNNIHSITSQETNFVNQKRIPEEFFLQYPDISPEQLSEFEDFKSFFKTPRDNWINTPFYYKIYNQDIKPVLQNANSKPTRELENIGKELCSGKLFVEKLVQVAKRDVCDGCGTQHNTYTYRVVSLNSHNQIENSWYMGTKCGMKLAAISFMYRVLNGISLLPITESIMKVAFQVLNIARESCRDVSGYKSVFL